MNDLVRIDHQLPMTATDMRRHVNLVQEVMGAVMKKDTHYGTIPGTPKPTLYKPGAEVLAATFRIAPSYKVEDLSGPGFVRYRVTCTGTHQGSGVILGDGMGECSSLEEKYKWRKASSAAEFDKADESLRRVKYGRDYETKQVRTEAADLANTILKMSCKRAQVAMTLNVTAASDIFTQDIEDLPEGYVNGGEGGDAGTGQAAASAETKPAYAKEQFDKNMPSWEKLMTERTKTATQIIATLQCKFTLTDEQIKSIKDKEPKE